MGSISDSDVRNERLRNIAVDMFNTKRRRGDWIEAGERQQYIEKFIEEHKDPDLDELERKVAAARPSPSEPDYSLTIIERGGEFIVCESSEEISKPFAELREAKGRLHYYRCWRQPSCCVCGSAIPRVDDPWEAYSVSSSSGADWMHQSCLKKFEHWANTTHPGAGPIPPMEVLDAAWKNEQH
jgi:hypothetical protein